MESKNLDAVRARAEAADLRLDESRLETLATSLESISSLMKTLERLPVDPLDVASGQYDPAWKQESDR